MIDKGSNHETQMLASAESARQATSFVSELINNLGDSEAFDAHRVLDEHPELQRFKSAVLNLALEQYCRATEAGERLDPSEFARTFPEYHHSLRCLLEVQDALQPALEAEEKQELSVSVGDEFLGFKLHELLGRGAFSRVFLATQTNFRDRVVVVKICRHGEHEVQALATLQHESIVTVHSVERDPTTNLTAICMPFLSRTTLQDVMDQIHGPDDLPTGGRAILKVLRERNDVVSPFVSALEGPSHAAKMLARESYVDAVIGFGVQLADALAHSHARGIYHGDIKPSNVLMTEDGKALLFDFNLSFTRDETAQIGGTLPYMSPEHLQAMAGGGAVSTHVGARSDIFSFGVMLYELLCGELPFGLPPAGEPRDTLVPKLLARQRVGPRSLQELNWHVDWQLAEVIQHCLAFHPEKRIASAAWLAEKLRVAQSRRLRRWLRINRRQVMLRGLAAVAVSAMAGGGVAAYVATRKPYAERRLEEGLAAFQTKQYQHAAQVLAETPEELLTDDIRLALARSYVMIGQYDEALSLLDEVQKRRPQVAAMFALRAECQAQLARFSGDRNGYYIAYIQFYFAKTFKLSNPALENNIAYMRHEQAKSNSERRAANATLQAVVDAGCQLPEPHHNLAMFDLEEARSLGRSPNPAHIERALECTKEPDAELHADAAKVYAAAWLRTVAPGKKAVYAETAKRHMRRAIELNAPRQLFGFLPHDPQLSGDPEFAEILAAAPEQTDDWPTKRLADSLLGDDSLMFAESIEGKHGVRLPRATRADSPPIDTQAKRK
ncbi:MAG: protein kinase [Pirellulaceae bacterium]